MGPQQSNTRPRGSEVLTKQTDKQTNKHIIVEKAHRASGGAVQHARRRQQLLQRVRPQWDMQRTAGVSARLESWRRCGPARHLDLDDGTSSLCGRVLDGLSRLVAQRLTYIARMYAGT